MKPLPQLVRRGKVAQPGIDSRFLLGQAARPQPVYENPEAVRASRFVVNSFERDRAGWNHTVCFCYFKATPKMPDKFSFRFRLLTTTTVWSCVALALFLLTGCEVERRKSDTELGLNPQQAAGRRVYDEYCDRCHAPYSSHGRQGPGLKGVFKNQYLPISGIPANDARVGEIIRIGRNKMGGYGNVLTQQQLDDMLAYMHTL